MIKKTKPISINILSVFIILTCLLLSVVGTTNAWFTDKHHDGILINISVGNLNLKLFQITKDSQDQEIETEILTNLKNEQNATDKDDNTVTQYIVLDGKIIPDEWVGLKLKLKNSDKGKSSMYVKFKFELYLRGVSSDTLVETEIKGYQSPDENTKGFVEGEEGFYYYKESSLQDANNSLIEQEEDPLIMTHFKVPYSSFVDANGNMLIKNSETIYIKIIVEASDVENF